MQRTIFPLLLLLTVFPLSIVCQNIGAAIAFIVLSWLIGTHGALGARSEVYWGRFRWPTILSLTYIAWLVVASVLNPLNPDKGFPDLVAGYGIWMGLPVLVYLAYRDLPAEQWQRLFRWIACISLIWAVIGTSQMLTGWEWADGHFRINEFRARGFYSHPLSFAYAALLLWPLGIASAIKWPRRLAGWVLAVSTAICFWTTESRTVQLIAVLILGVNVIFYTQRRLRTGLVLAGIVFSSVIGLTKNPVSTKFRMTLAGKADHESDYPDDRLAFWAANWQLVTERPLLGHGIHLPDSYRDHAYAEIGEGTFSKKYPSHNMYLEILVEGGLVGLICFGAWFAWYLGYARRLCHYSPFAGSVLLQTLLGFALASVTQNAFQDAVVRFGLTLVCAAAWLVPRKPS